MPNDAQITRRRRSTGFLCHTSLLAPGISPETTGATNYPDATVAQVDATVQMKSPITKGPTPRKGKRL